MRRPLLVPLAAALAAAALLPGCARGDAAEGRVGVAAGLYPLAYVAARVGGPDVSVTDLTPSGAEPHDVELTPGQVSTIERADLVLVVSGLQPAVDDAARGRDVLDALSAVRARPRDPHFWLDPELLRQYALAVAQRLVEIDPPHAEAYRQRAARLAADLALLDAAWQGGLRGCARHEVVTSHAAFGYLARYGLTQVGISGLSPEAEPAPGQLAEVTRYVRDHGVTTVFFETLVSPKVAGTVARETGARTAVLDPVESGTDYLGAMRANLAALRAALECR
jgi:zinc transport system substrate-binding protein